MIAQHEQQHDETMLITHQLRSGPAGADRARPPPDAADAHRLPAEVLVPGGPFTMGTSTEPWALDNERPAHQREVPAFCIDTTAGDQRRVPGVHRRRRLRRRSAGGRRRAGRTSASTASTRRCSGGGTAGSGCAAASACTEPVPADEPVLHVCWYEADAYARWAGRRLPTEAEWEKAARHDPARGRSPRYPWGDADPAPDHANLGQRHLRPAPAGSYPAGASPLGVRQLIGDVWEWTSSDFLPYPGFAAFPYREYSEVFFGPDVQGAARRFVRRRTRWPAAARSATGTIRSAGRSSPASAPRGTRRSPARPAGEGRALMCRHLAYLGPARPLGELLIEPAARPVPAVLGAAAAAARHGQRRRFRRRLVRRGRPGAGPLPARRARSGPTCPSPTSPGWCAPGALLAAVRDATWRARTARPRAAPFAAGPWLFSHNGAVGGWPGSLAPLAPVLPPAELLVLEARCDSALVWALVLHRLRARRRARARRWPTPSSRSPRPRPAPGSTCCSPTARRSPRPPGATRSGTCAEPGRRTVVASEPYDDDPRWREVPDRTLLAATRTDVLLTPLKEPTA